jgi:hypothetical protein
MRGDGALVLVGFGEALSAPEVVWSLQEAGYRVACFTRRGARPVVRRIRGVGLHELAAPEQDLDAAAAELTAIVERVRPDLLMPLDDPSVLLTGLPGVAAGTRQAGPDGARLTLALDKREQLAAATAAGFRPPATRVLDHLEQALEIGDFPLVLKPALAAQREGNRLVRGAIRFCADRGALEAAVRAGDVQAPVLAQEVLRGVGEGIVGLGDGNGAPAMCAHQRIRMMNPAGSGSSACRGVPLERDLGERTDRMLAAAGWRGLFMVELLRERDGGARFMELNGRAWGSLALSRRMGLELPAYAAAEALGTAPSPWPRVRIQGPPLVCRHAGRELVHLMFVMRGGRPAAVRDWPPRWQTLRDVLRVRRSDRWYNRQPGYGALMLEDTFRTVKDAVARAL